MRSRHGAGCWDTAGIESVRLTEDFDCKKSWGTIAYVASWHLAETAVTKQQRHTFPYESSEGQVASEVAHAEGEGVSSMRSLRTGPNCRKSATASHVLT